MDILNIIALVMLSVISITAVYVIIYIHDIPYEIAKKRNHPHQDAIHVAGWVSLFLMHTIWPFLWIWAHLFKPGDPSLISVKAENADVQALLREVQSLKEEVKELKDSEEESTDNPKSK